ncbi:MAG TPA: outer membrane protein assembly factor BamB, partial [Gammaproteobacteria bacterium]
MIRSAVIGCALLCAGCAGVSDSVTRFMGGKDNTEPPSPLVEFQSKLNVIELWSASVGGGTAEQYLKLVPALSTQRLYVADSDGRVEALDATNGTRLWSTDVDERITGGPGVGENAVLVGTGEGGVIALDSETGRRLWRATVSSEVLSPPLKSEGIVIVRTNDGKVFALDGAKGTQMWIYDRTVPALTLRGTSSPVIVRGVVIAGFDAGRLAALDLRTGRLLWEVSVATARGRSELERMVDIDSDPLIVDDVIYVTTFQGQLAAVQLDGGRILWSRDISSYAGFTADESYIYLTDDNSNVWTFDRYSGATHWRQELLHARAATGPASIGNFTVVGDLEGYLHWMHKSDGSFVARTRLSSRRIIVQPLVAGKVLYAY